MPTSRRTLRLVGMLLAILLAGVANAPAPYWACAGKVAGDPCEPYGSSYGCRSSRDHGFCRVGTSRDDPDTAVDESLFCDTR